MSLKIKKDVIPEQVDGSIEATEKELEDYIDKHPAVRKTASFKKIKLEKLTVKERLAKIKKFFSSPKEKQEILKEEAAQHALFDKIEEQNKHHLEKPGHKRIRYDELSALEKSEIDEIYKKLQHRLHPDHCQYEKREDFDKIMNDLEIAKNYDVNWFKDLAQHHGLRLDKISHHPS